MTTVNLCFQFHSCCWGPSCYFYPSTNSNVVMVMPQRPRGQIVRDTHLTDCNSQGVATSGQMLSSVCHFFGCWMNFAYVPEVFKDSSQICRSCKDLDISIWYQFQSVTWMRAMTLNQNQFLESRNQAFPLRWFSRRKEYMKWQNWATFIPFMPIAGLSPLGSWDSSKLWHQTWSRDASPGFDILCLWWITWNWTANAQQLVYVVVVVEG